ncbi:NFAT activation molecule 1 [Loxodonta africana]|uniref:NFAT activation molecule 1 n=1 Tax=Loxodonta africana TaxID=9785 RepID=UPI0030CD954D
MTSGLLGLLLFSWTLQMGGEQSVTHTGPPIVVSLANKVISFGCKITYLYTPKYKSFIVLYYYVDRQNKYSPKKLIDCQPSQGTENQTHTVECQVTPELPDSSATGTYYCSVRWQHITKDGNGTFILVRDSGYREPPQGSQDSLLFGFTSLLTLLSVLGTALLLWKKKQVQVPRKQPVRKCQDPRSASSPKQPPCESIYTDLQRRETEVYACIEGEANSPPFSRSPFSQEGLNISEDGEFGLVYENL